MMRLPRTVALIAAAAVVASVAPVSADEVVTDDVVVTEEKAAPETAAAETVTETESSWLAVVVDLVIGRPTLLMATVAGGAFYALSWPITYPGGIEPDARDRFLTPARQLVETPLGGELTPASS